MTDQPTVGVALKPCPHCTSEDLIVLDLKVWCGHCKAYGPAGTSADEAVGLWNTRAPASGAVEAIVQCVVERAEQACRYALKYQEFEADPDGTDRYRDGWEIAAEVCEKSIAEHVSRHIKADLAALTSVPKAEGAVDLSARIFAAKAQGVSSVRLSLEEAERLTAPQPLQGGEVTRDKLKSIILSACADHDDNPWGSAVSEAADAILALLSAGRGEEGDDLDLYDDKVQQGIAWTMRQWGETLGLDTWDQGDGSESVEGDVGAEIHTILVDAGLRDPETNQMASLPAGGEDEAWLDALKKLADDWTPKTTGRKHDLKCWPAPFAANRAGLKTWELRKNDRDYQVGDLLWQQEWDPATEAYSGEATGNLVTWMLEGPAFGLPEGYVIMSLDVHPATIKRLISAARKGG